MQHLLASFQYVLTFCINSLLFCMIISESKSHPLSSYFLSKVIVPYHQLKLEFETIPKNCMIKCHLFTL